jgi:uncharacterized protein YdhG (YjbR/CyaY superfamily)
VAATTTKKATAKNAPTTVEDYLAGAPKDKRAALTTLRRTIKAAAPRATEGVSYGIVGYKLGGQRLVYFGYWKTHIALYGSSGRFNKTHAAELKPYAQSKGTIQFADGKPIPVRLVTQIVKARVAEVEAAESRAGLPASSLVSLTRAGGSTLDRDINSGRSHEIQRSSDRF